ncbi:MAG: hypothetical protein LBK61_06190 [Spirochaetaceae bacterium]|nr:hypothetical protein [Spirochaetaceae bacterium]
MSTGFALFRGRKIVKKNEKRAFFKNCKKMKGKSLKQWRIAGTPVIPGLEKREIVPNTRASFGTVSIIVPLPKRYQFKICG